MEKRLLQIFVLLLVIFVVWKIWNPLWRMDLNEAVDTKSTEKIVFNIEKGSSAREVANDLEDEDLIVSSKSFIREAKKQAIQDQIRYGKFVLSPSMQLTEILTILTTQGTGELALTVIEGTTREDVDAKLVEMDLIKAGEFIDCTRNCKFEYDFLSDAPSLEGYLFPDTYFIDSTTYSNEYFINQMLQNFDKKFDETMNSQLNSSGRSMKDMVIVASMLEKEVRTEKDLPLVAGIIWKRLDNEWALGIDATLLYGESDHEISAEDLTKDTPYNTRLNKGLPPTAIGNPGLKSLQAALATEASEYWFYLTDEDGEVHYATTNEEHEANKERYLD